MSDKIRDRLGLDFLRPLGSPESDRPPREDPAMSDALMAYGWRVLDFLSNANNGTAKVYELIDRVQIPIEIALKIVDYLESRGIVQVTQRDLKGDHTLAITPAGRSILSQYAAR